MIYDLKAPKGEQLFTMIITQTNEPQPSIYIGTWDTVLARVEELTKDRNDERYFTKTVKFEKNDNLDLEAIVIENHKGWGHDYVKTITVRRAYYHY